MWEQVIINLRKRLDNQRGFGAILDPLYTWLGASPILKHWALNSALLYQLFSGTTLSYVKCLGSSLGQHVLKGKVLVMRFNLSWIDGRDVHSPMHDPNWPMLDLRAAKTLSWFLFFFNRPEDLTPIFFHLGHHIRSPMFSPNLDVRPNPNNKCLDRIRWNWTILLDQVFRARIGPQSGPKYCIKWAL